MKRNVITIACAAVVVAAIVVPLGVGGAPAPETAVLPQATQGADVAANAEDAEAVGANAGSGADASGDAAEAGAGTSADADDAYEKGVILVGLQDGATAADLNARLAQLDYIATKQVADDDITLGYAELALADGIDVKSAENRIAADASDVVAAAQPNYRYHIADEAATPATAAAQSDSLITGIIAQTTEINDPKAYKQESTDAISDYQWALGAVKAFDAWDTARAGDAGDSRVTVAVIDNGFLVNHEDLADNIVASYNALDGGTDVTPQFGGHGTHVCGIVSAVANNGKGVAGVSYNAGLLPIQTFSRDEDGDASTDSISLLNAYSYIEQCADEYSVKVVNMSLGATQNDADPDDKALVRAVKSAYDNGILTVCAAGNEAEKNHGAYKNFPSDFLGEYGLGVIALDSDGKRASYSNYNTTRQTKSQSAKDIAAPGSSILSTYSTTASSYGQSSGTSMASPYVAGVAALVYSVNPGLSAADVTSFLCNTATDLGKSGWDADFGYGEVNAAAAIEAVAAKGCLEAAGATTLDVDGTTTLTPSVDDSWTWTSNNERVATVSSDGKVTAHSHGKALIKAVSTTTGAELSRIITVKDTLDTARVTLSQSRFTYDGTAKKPEVTVVLRGNVLTQGVSYKLDYASNVNAGTGTVTVTGLGTCSGTIATTFTIAPAPLTSIALSASSFVYDGGVKSPAATVTGPKSGRAGQTLTRGSDYTLATPSGCRLVGAYAVGAVGKGNYTGKVSATFTIVPQGTKVSKVKAAKKGFTVKWRKQAAQTSGYQVQYSLKKNFASKTKTVTVSKVKTTSKKIKKLRAKKRYYVRVRTFTTVGGERYYSAWSPLKSVKTRA